MPSTEARVAALYYYPIKSTYRHEANELEIVDTGFKHDRQWMLTHPDGVFMSQRRTPKLATIRTELVGDLLKVQLGDETLELPHYPVGSGADDSADGDAANESASTIFGQEVATVDYGDEVAQALENYLGKPCRLVTMHKDHKRAVGSSKRAQEDSVSFADGYPFLLTSMTSLDDLNRRIRENGGEPVDMYRFRANIVIEGLNEAYVEDNWSRIRIGEAEFLTPKVSTRCAVTTIDQDTGARGKGEPLKTLAKYRMGDSRRVMFGMNLQHVKGSGTTIKLNDPLVVIS